MISIFAWAAVFGLSSWVMVVDTLPGAILVGLSGLCLSIVMATEGDRKAALRRCRNHRRQIDDKRWHPMLGSNSVRQKTCQARTWKQQPEQQRAYGSSRNDDRRRCR